MVHREAMDGLRILEADGIVRETIVMVAARHVQTEVDDFLEDGRVFLVSGTTSAFWSSYVSRGNGSALDGWPLTIRAEPFATSGGKLLPWVAGACVNSGDYLIREMLISPKELAAELGITAQAATTILRRLTKAGVVSGRNYRTCEFQSIQHQAVALAGREVSEREAKGQPSLTINRLD